MGTSEKGIIPKRKGQAGAHSSHPMRSAFFEWIIKTRKKETTGQILWWP